MIVRVFDCVLSFVGLVTLSPLLLLIGIVGYFDTGAPLLRQVRIGRNGKPFTLVKFRTMRVGTAFVGTHEVDTSAITRLGGFLRRTKLDELPQLWNVFFGQMSLVGPRPSLPSQVEVISRRKELGVLAARPGVTGLAQLRAIDMSEPQLLAATDSEMLSSLTVLAYFRYICRSILGAGSGDRVRVPRKDISDRLAD